MLAGLKMKNFRLAVKTFIINKNNRVLLLKRSMTDIQKPGIWEIPGGRLELGENPFDGLKREVKEETGIDINIIHTVNIRHFERDDGQTITLIIFLSRPLNEKVKIKKEEHDGFEWVDFGSCKEKINKFFHSEVDIINKLRLDKNL